MPIIFHFSTFYNVGDRFIIQKQGTFIQMLTLTEQHENSVTVMGQNIIEYC